MLGSVRLIELRRLFQEHAGDIASYISVANNAYVFVHLWVELITCQVHVE